MELLVVVSFILHSILQRILYCTFKLIIQSISQQPVYPKFLRLHYCPIFAVFYSSQTVHYSRITESFSLERTLSGHPVQPPAQSKVNAEFRPACPGSWKPPKIGMWQTFWATCPNAYCPHFLTWNWKFQLGLSLVPLQCTWVKRLALSSQ